MTADTATRLVLISQEQRDQAESLGELRHALTLAVQRIEKLEQQVAMLKAAWMASKTEGAECCIDSLGTARSA